MTTKVLSIIAVLTLLLGGMLVDYLQTLPANIVTKTIYKEKLVIKKQAGVLQSILQVDLKNDLAKNYKYLSPIQQEEILSAILKSSKEFKINPLVVYSLASIESDFRFWIVSSERTVVGSDGKKHRDRAIGTTSVIYSIWGKLLNENNIISTKTELYQITPNIRAGAFILATLRDRYKGDINKALKSYFGKSNYAKVYLRKIQRKVGQLVWNKVK